VLSLDELNAASSFVNAVSLREFLSSSFVGLYS